MNKMITKAVAEATRIVIQTMAEMQAQKYQMQQDPN